ncbi:hypothetical protein HYH03_008734 [Edaphochlamys debaryana]|uniref:Uncharacterized protein n=1 Tax=Edaphochlamys debaryana TaxID=47281 RepID=A0A835Y2T4_9CHLO|nr:hypothetical protein HYH03_008734 [Edaphochlamys debaryana]|eukprot:KAG2493071.1 hypothetical protein HYH03_008734 [Edaphochlamys debaryana]
MDGERENPAPLARLPGADDQPWQDWSPELETAYLQHLAGVERLEDATSLQLVVNTATGGSISHLGSVLPNLHELNLNGSSLDSLRDLGTGFRLLQVLWVSRCGLRGLDGLNGLPALRELYAAYNDIADLSPVDACAFLEVLDLECNCVADPEAVLYLAACPNLQTLTLTGNPAAEVEGYRRAVCGELPALLSLDDEAVTRSDRGLAEEPASEPGSARRSLESLHGEGSEGQPSQAGEAAAPSPRLPGREVVGGASAGPRPGTASARPPTASPLPMAPLKAAAAALHEALTTVPDDDASTPTRSAAARRGPGAQPDPDLDVDALLLPPASSSTPTAASAAASAASAPFSPASAAHHAPLTAPTITASVIASVPTANAPPEEPPDAEEVAMVVAGIKHARVGVDSREFREIEMNLLVATADGTDVHLESRPGTAVLLPASTSTWMRTLRSSREGSLAQLRASAAAAAGRGGGAGSVSGSSHSGSPGSSRPQSSQVPPRSPGMPPRSPGLPPRSPGPQDRWAQPVPAPASQPWGAGSGVGASGWGMSQSFGATAGSGLAPWRPGTALHTGPSGGAPDSPGFRRPNSGDRASTANAAARPFSARPGTASSFSVRIGTAGSTGPPATASTGLYWAKNRIESAAAAAAGGGGAHPSGSRATAAAAVAEGVGAATDGASVGSKLTQGSGAAFGGSLAKDLRKWKGAAARSSTSASGDADHPGTSANGAGGPAPDGAASHGRGNGNGLSMTLLRGGQLDPKALLEELKRWKLETADKVLFVDPDEAAAEDLDQPSWAGISTNGGRAADILTIGGSGDGAGEMEAAAHAAEALGSPMVPSSPLQPARLPPRVAAENRRKMVLAKVVRDIAADTVGESDEGPICISEIIKMRPVHVPPGLRDSVSKAAPGPGGPGAAHSWAAAGADGGLQVGTPDRLSIGSPPAQASHTAHHPHHHASQRPSSGRSGCSSSGQSDLGFGAMSISSRPESREEHAPSTSGGGLAPAHSASLGRTRSEKRAPGLPPGPSAPGPGQYRVASVAGEMDVRSSNPQPVTRWEHEEG